MTSTGNKLPTFDRLMVPLIRALQGLGGSGSIEEIYDKVVELERFPDDVLSQMHDPEKSHETEVAYRLAWARTYLKKYGLLENSTRGIWSLTSKIKEIGELDPRAVVQLVRGLARKEKESNSTGTVDSADADVPEEEAEWKHKLHAVLTQNLSSASFERLVQRVLRESGFTQVEVTGRTGDGGIDGRGIARINGLMSFHVLFQCERYKGSVGAGECNLDRILS